MLREKAARLDMVFLPAQSPWLLWRYRHRQQVGFVNRDLLYPFCQRFQEEAPKRVTAAAEEAAAE